MDLLTACKDFIYAIDQYRNGGMLVQGVQSAEVLLRKAIQEAETQDNKSMGPTGDKK